MLRELQPGEPEFVGPYALRGVLGVGGMGRVYLGVVPPGAGRAGGHLVAVKVIRADLAADSEFRARFRREVAVARKVSSQYTAPVIDADLEGPTPWLATAYVTGPSLADAVAEHGPLPVGSVLKLATGLAEGLSAIHAAGVVHRDLKPANVLLADDGPRVIDFGISLGAEASALTRTGLVVGSPGYMSPEQAEGREVGPASDIFSLGAVLAFAATGQGPFGTGSTPALVYRVVHSPAGLEDVPAELRELIGSCLAKDPRQRPTARGLLTQTSVQPTVGWLPEPVTRTFMALPTVLDAPDQFQPRQDQPRQDRRQRRGIGRRLTLAAVITGVLAASVAGGAALAASGHPSSAGKSGAAVTAHTSSPATTPTARPSTSPATPTASTSAPATTQQSTPPASPTPTASSATPSASATPTTSAPASTTPAATGSPATTGAPAGTGSPAANGSPAGQSPAAQSPAAQSPAAQASAP